MNNITKENLTDDTLLSPQNAVDLNLIPGVNYTQLKRMIDSGKIKSVDIGTGKLKHRKICKKWIREFLGEK